MAKLADTIQKDLNYVSVNVHRGKVPKYVIEELKTVLVPNDGIVRTGDSFSFPYAKK